MTDKHTQTYTHAGKIGQYAVWRVYYTCIHRACSHENESRSGTWFSPFLIWKPDVSPCERKALSNQAFEMRFETHKKSVFWIMIRVESLILGHVNAKLFRNAIRACAFWKCALKPCWSHAWVNQRGLHSRNKILPHSAQILIVIGKAFAMHVNARSSNHDPNHVLDRDPKRLSERDSFSCEHSHNVQQVPCPQTRLLYFQSQDYIR